MVPLFVCKIRSLWGWGLREMSNRWTYTKRTRRERLLNSVSLLRICHRQGVQVSTASDLELGDSSLLVGLNHHGYIGGQRRVKLCLVHLASFLLVVIRKSLISLICLGIRQQENCRDVGEKGIHGFIFPEREKTTQNLFGRYCYNRCTFLALFQRLLSCHTVSSDFWSFRLCKGHQIQVWYTAAKLRRFGLFKIFCCQLTSPEDSYSNIHAKIKTGQLCREYNFRRQLITFYHLRHDKVWIRQRCGILLVFLWSKDIKIYHDYLSTNVVSKPASF